MGKKGFGTANAYKLLSQHFHPYEQIIYTYRISAPKRYLFIMEENVFYKDLASFL